MNEAAFVIVVIKLTKSKCEEPYEGRLSSTVPREGWVKSPPLTRQEICNDEKKDNLYFFANRYHNRFVSAGFMWRESFCGFQDGKC